ncbi:type IV pili methyl-accepting chemotaxis transducer N-terminal domain-containing protein [Echinicola sp. CAU 1574]|uniref:Oxygen sensor histidine kinase NreB n=1 Tax=Echinicola arenosa TaxID=2774144 RepID=A0ABR9AI55_9BACT|nr:ATP-binding protein [Echinicola arenosa]MBD8487986.1 type IV pili methyl-accepting chemotaxis transducer N-terminal domain-containing protein [Echinicola arenosa]
MENHDLSDKPTYEKLARYYLIALCAIATSIILSQVLVQKFISQQKNDSRVINISGRQRMLSQRISKCALLLGDSISLDKRSLYLKQLDNAVQDWEEAHLGLRQGNKSLGINGKNSKTVEALFEEIETDHQTILASAKSILGLLHQELSTPTQEFRKDISNIIKHEEHFLNGMDQIVFQYDNEAKTKVTNLQSVEIFLLVLSLGVILFEIFFIFIPSAKTIKKTFLKLLQSERKSKKMTLEISSLYSSLEQAYQDLLEVDVAVEDFTVFAKSKPNGDFYYFSDKFSKLMEFEEESPYNLFDWLQEQGYDAKYLQNIQKMMFECKTWSGEIKVTNDAGDFVWLKMNITPTMDDSGEVASLMIISTDQTEKKEAEAISQEINRERIEKKVKEQQFRSALILEGQEEERKRISRDMHDGVGQLLSAMKFNLEGIHSVSSDFEKEKLKTSKDLLKNVIKEVRRISFNLTPSALSDYGIVPVLNKFCREITKLSDLKVTFENETGFLSRLEGKIENNLYRICQEAVNNAIKYAEASEVKIKLSHNSRFLNLEIADDGKGFDITQLEMKGHFSASGHGLFNIRERANFINGQCTISSEKGKGTTISINIPLD